MSMTTPEQKAAATKYAREWRAKNREHLKERNRKHYNEVYKHTETHKKQTQKSAKQFMSKCSADPEFKAKRDAATKAYRLKNFARVRLKVAEGRAKTRGMEFTITEADITWNTVCPILGIPLNYSNSAQLDDSPSIDRIDNSKGYIPGNVVVISWKANNLKSNGQREDFEKLITWMKTQQEPIAIN
jgi:hypothetical protein